MMSSRMASTTAATPAIGGAEEEEESKSAAPKEFSAAPLDERKAIASYWGIGGNKLVEEDGTEWKWSCFRPSETYKADLSIDLKKHHVPTMMLETVAAVPGMVGGMLLHLLSLRRFEQSGGWIYALLEEAENERMHLMTFMEVAKPRWYERALVIAVQGIFFNAYFVGYILSSKFAHHVVGYLEEEAIHSYTEFLKEIDAGKIPIVLRPAPTPARAPPDSLPCSTLQRSMRKQPRRSQRSCRRRPPAKPPRAAACPPVPSPVKSGRKTSPLLRSNLRSVEKKDVQHEPESTRLLGQHNFWSNTDLSAAQFSKLY